MNRSILFFALCFAFSTAYSQEKPPKDSLKVILNAADEYKKFLPNYAPLSPNIASMMKFGDFQVNLSTGIPDISLPLYTAVSGKITQPITLRYHAGGFRMSDQASWTGWGFSLDFGTSVNRTAQGIADDDPNIDHNYLNTPFQQSRNFCNIQADFDFGNSVLTGQTDIQPDIFSYSTGKTSGKFLLGQGSNPMFLIPYQPIKVSKSHNVFGKIDRFNIIDSDGLEYIFGEQANGIHIAEQQSATEASRTQTYFNNFPITQIKSPNTDDKIDFFYQNGGSQFLYDRQWSTSIIFGTNPPPCAPYDPPNGCSAYYLPTGTSTPIYSSVSTTISQYNIQQIVFENGRIEFEQSNVGERQDLTSSRFLKKIRIYNIEGGVETLQRVVDFTYGYFTNIDGNNARLKLEKVSIQNSDNSDRLDYNFTYKTNSFSWSDDYFYKNKQDFFGFFNGKPNQHLISISSYNGVPIQHGAADRQSVTEYMQECILDKITFPTGGETRFEFENNKYKFNDTEYLAGGLRVTKIISKPSSSAVANIKRYSYNSEEGEGVGRFPTNWFPQSNNVPFIQQLNHHNLSYSTTSTASQATFTQNGFLDKGSFDQAIVYYTHVKEYFEEDSDPIKNGRNEYFFNFRQDFIVDQLTYHTRDMKPWLRGQMTKKEIYDNNNNLVASTINNYDSYNNQSISVSGYVERPIIYEGDVARTTIFCPTTYIQFPMNEMNYGTYSYFTGSSQIANDVNLIDGVSTTKYYFYDPYLFISKIETDDSYTNHKKIQEFIYPTDNIYNSDAVSLEMINRNMISTPLETIEKEDLNGTINMLDKQKTVFQHFSGNNARGLFQNILPSQIWVAPTGNLLEKRVDFTEYDSYGNPNEYKVDNVPTALVWGYNNALMLCQVKNTTFSQVITALSSAGISVTDFSIVNLNPTQLNQLQNFRNNLPLGLASWFSYKPLFGLSSSIAPNGLISSFEYDGLGRLHLTKDHEGNLTNIYSYFLGQPQSKISTAKVRIETNDVSTALSAGNSIINHQYSDGLGRPIQIVGQRQTPNQNDLISESLEYDKFGRVISKVLTFPNSSNSGSHQSNPLSLAQSFYTDNAPFSTITYESSPLNRIKSSFGAGQAWHNADKKTQIFYESAGSDVRYYKVDGSGNIVWDGYFPNNSLFKKRSIDEQGHTAIEITDKRGRTIQKQIENDNGFLTTYYINDGLGREIAIIQPKGFALGANIDANTPNWNNYVFFNLFDNRGRLYAKKVPNADTEFMVYDNWDRLVMMQEGYQREKGFWKFFKYDYLDRLVLSGLKSDASNHSTLQNQANSWTGDRYESRVGSGIYHSYSNTFPQIFDENNIKLAYYFDDYNDWIPSGTTFDNVNAFHSQYTNSKSLPTGSRHRSDTNGDWLVSVSYFDSKNRTIQSFEKTDINQIERLESQYNFAGETLKSRFTHKTPQNIEIIEENENEIDHVGRLKGTFHSLKEGSNLDNRFKTASYQFDEIGRLLNKKIQPNGGQSNRIDYIERNAPPFDNTTDVYSRYILLNSGVTITASNANKYLACIGTYNPNQVLQCIDYKYHIRGGIKCINCSSNNPQLNQSELDLFAYRLDYEDDGVYFDGNIRKQYWLNKNDNQLRNYTFQYDASSRIKQADFIGNGSENYSLSGLNYDNNGNITALQRNGKDGSNYTTIDNLSYNISGNQLIGVTDAVTSNQDIGDFRDNGSNNDYTYWTNGSLKTDANKTIELINYDVFNKLVNEIQLSGSRWINYKHDAGGAKVRQIDSEGNEQLYISNIIYKKNLQNNQFEFYQLNFSEGRVIKNGNQWQYEYFYTDHLGNNRLAFRDSLGYPAIVSINDFEPLGMRIKPLSVTKNSNQNRYGFNKIEEISEFNLNINDAFFRTLDTQIGRWWQIDPKPSMNQSLYTSMDNNPIRNIDYLGDTTYLYTLKGVYKGVLYDKMKTNEIVLLSDDKLNSILSQQKGGKTNDNALAATVRSADFADARITGRTISALTANWRGKGQNEASGFLYVDPKTKEVKVSNCTNCGTSPTSSDVSKLNQTYDKIASKGSIIGMWHSHPDVTFQASQPSNYTSVDYTVGASIVKSFASGAVGVVVNKNTATIYPVSNPVTPFTANRIDPLVTKTKFSKSFTDFGSSTQYGVFNRNITPKTYWTK